MPYPAAPDQLAVYATLVDEPDRADLGDVWEAARVAGVRPGTIAVWVTRGKIRPVLDGEGGALYHLPTVRAAAEAGRKFKPSDPAANSRRPHARRTAA